MLRDFTAWGKLHPEVVDLTTEQSLVKYFKEHRALAPRGRDAGLPRRIPRLASGIQPGDSTMAFHHQKMRYSIREYCDLTGTGRSKFFERVRRGEISVVKVGKRSFITADEADRVANLDLPFACQRPENITARVTKIPRKTAAPKARGARGGARARASAPGATIFLHHQRHAANDQFDAVHRTAHHFVVK